MPHCYAHPKITLNIAAGCTGKFIEKILSKLCQMSEIADVGVARLDGQSKLIANIIVWLVAVWKFAKP